MSPFFVRGRGRFVRRVVMPIDRTVEFLLTESRSVLSVLRKTSTALVRLRVIPALLVLLLTPLRSTAHPLSYTDAWIKVSDVVEVRLNVFLDDVVRYSNGDASSQNVVSSAVVAEAIRTYGRILPSQLRIFADGGQPLSGTVVTEPTWEESELEFDLSADSSLKLTWNLKYVHSEQASEITLLSFLHQFSFPAPAEPGEMRLHLRHVKSGRRFDAVIPPDRSHTLIFPNSSVGKSRVDGINGAHSRLIIGAVDVVHEFIVPLSLLQSMLPLHSTDHHVRATDQTELIHFLSPEAAEDVRDSMRRWMNDNVQLTIDNRSVRAESHYLEWMAPLEDSVFGDAADNGTAGHEPAQKSIGGVATSTSVPLFGTRLGIRSVFRRPATVRSVELTFADAPGAFSELDVETISVFGQKEEILPFKKNDEGSCQPLSIHWNAPVKPEPADATLAVDQTRNILICRSNRGAVIGTGLAAIGLLFASLLVFIKHSGRLRILFSSILLLSAAGAFFLPIHDEWRASQDDAAALTTSLLKHVYQSAATADEDAAVSQLSAVLDDDLVEEIYLNTRSSYQLNAADPLLISIQDVSVDSFIPNQDTVSANSVTGDAHWRVTGMVHHWGHTHSRELLQSGRIRLVLISGRWKIQTVTMTSVGKFEAADDIGRASRPGS